MIKKIYILCADSKAALPVLKCTVIYLTPCRRSPTNLVGTSAYDGNIIVGTSVKPIKYSRIDLEKTLLECEFDIHSLGENFKSFLKHCLRTCKITYSLDQYFLLYK